MNKTRVSKEAHSAFCWSSLEYYATAINQKLSRSVHTGHSNAVQDGVSLYTHRQIVPVILAYTLYPINLTNLF